MLDMVLNVVLNLVLNSSSFVFNIVAILGWRSATLLEIVQQIYFAETFNILNFDFNSEILKRATFQ